VVQGRELVYKRRNVVGSPNSWAVVDIFIKINAEKQKFQLTDVKIYYTVLFFFNTL
jgi:hypothetical protein